MPHITFIKDVTIETEPAGTGPHFRRGYSPDVSEAEARKWIGRGLAVRGVVKFDQDTDHSDKTEAPQLFKRRKSRFER